MKKFLLLLVVVVCLCFSQTLFAQVFADFEDASMGTQGFWYGWGNAGSNLQRVDDPTHGGVLTLDINVVSASGDDAKAAIGGPDPLPLGWTENSVGAFFLTFDVFVPADFPDSAQVKIWSQDKVNWTWNDVKYSPLSDWGGPLQKGAWNTLTFSVQRTNQLNPNYVPWNAKGGIEFWFGTAGWSGTVKIDNATVWGVEPKLEADFENENLGTQGFWYGWGNAGSNLQRITDPTHGGVLSVDVNVISTAGDDAKAAIGAPDPLPLDWTETTVGAAFFTVDVYVPADFPDSAQVKVWCQDKVNWTWNDIKFSPISDWGKPLQKGVWNTVGFPVKRTNQLNPNFAPWNAKGGIELWFGVAGWAGTVFIDNFRVHTMEVGKKWVVADFEKESLGTNDFENTGWNLAMTAINWAADPTAQSAGVLQTDWNSSLDTKAQFVHNNLDLQWTDTDTGATSMSMDVWLPADIPAGTEIGFWATDKVSWSWTETKFTITDSTVVPGQWNTITYDVKANLANLDPTGVIRAGMQIVFSDLTWTGTIYWDNFTLHGIEKPAGALASPAVAVALDTSAALHSVYAQVAWTDNEEALNETYNIYVSESPITDLTAAGVVKIGSKISRGIQDWNHRPYTTDGSEVTLYYAVTATGLDGTETELNDVCTTGAIVIPSSRTIKAIYDPNFAFVIDGSLSDFAKYVDFNIPPEGAGQDNAGDWTPTSTDLNLSQLNFVIDDEFLYVGANVIDDDLATEGQAWEGDALELYLSFYNALELTALHDLGDRDSYDTGDWRISFTAWGDIQKGGTSKYDFPGMEALILPSPTGYQIEAKIALDSMIVGGYTPQVGDFLPLRVDVNDRDLVADAPETGRTKMLHVGGVGNDQNWKRPSSWGYLEVYIPSAVQTADNIFLLPKKTQLHNNYPNPFNPTTNIKFDLASSGHVSLEIYNMLGQKIKTLVDAEKAAGYHSINWSGANDAGIKVSSGIYFYKFKTAELSQTFKMILMK